MLLLYAQNLAPIPGTDLSRSRVAVGREFSLPIDCFSSKHFELTSCSPESVQSYAKIQAELISASCNIVKVLLEEHCAYHCELFNLRRLDPHLFEEGDIVFA